MTRLRTLSAIALSVALVPAAATFAQAPAGVRGGGGFSNPGGTESGFPGRAAGNSMIDIEFGGGNLAQYLEHLQVRNGVRNIIMASEELAKVSMPEVKLTGVLFTDAVELPHFLAKPPEGQHIHIDAVGSSKSIFVVGVRSPIDGPSWIDPMHKPISFDFKGGSLDEFVAEVQAAAGTKQVLMRGKAAEFEMPPLQMEKVTLYGVLSALDGDERRHSNGDRSRLNVGDRDGVYLVEVQTESPSRQSTEANRVQTMSWSIALLRGPHRLSTEELLTAIEAAVEVSGGVDTTTLRFHNETSLLIVSATGQTIQMIDSVLHQLSQSAMASAAAEQEATKHRSMLTSEAAIARSRMEYASELLNYEENRLNQLQMHFDSGNLTEDELHKQRLAVLETRAKAQEAEARLREAEEQLARIQSQSEANE